MLRLQLIYCSVLDDCCQGAEPESQLVYIVQTLNSTKQQFIKGVLSTTLLPEISVTGVWHAHFPMPVINILASEPTSILFLFQVFYFNHYGQTIYL